MELLARYKKIFFILGFIAVVIILGFLIYRTFFQPTITSQLPSEQPQPVTPVSSGLPASGVNTKKPGATIINQQPETTPSAPATAGKEIPQKISEVAAGGLTKVNEISQANTASITAGNGGSGAQFYDKDTQKFYRIDKNGNAQPLSDKQFYNVQNTTWSPNKNEAVLSYPDDSKIIYNFETNKQVTLPKHWKDFVFSPDGSKLAMKSMGLDPDNHWLAVVNNDGTQSRSIENMGDNESKVYPSWSPNNQSIAMYTKGIDFDRQEVFFVGLNGENFKSTIIQGRGFQPQWAPDGNHLLYSVYSSDNNFKPTLWIVAAAGENIGADRRLLGVDTWANKCAFANSYQVYCAVPENLEDNSGLFPELANNTKDNLYKIDVRTGSKVLIAIPDASYNISSLTISDNNSSLYFTDQTTQKLYDIKLNP